MNKILQQNNWTHLLTLMKKKGLIGLFRCRTLTGRCLLRLELLVVFLEEGEKDDKRQLYKNISVQK